MPFSRDWISWLLLAVALTCLVVGVFPQWSEWVDPLNGDRVSERRLGLWFSPVHQSVRREHPQGGFTWEAGPNWVSWSSLLLVAGLVGFEMFRGRRRNLTPSAATSCSGGAGASD
jgi:hypothetical protein